MSERKPPGVGWQSWTEHQIEAARREGAFDRLPGRSRPIADLDLPHDDLWWVKDKLRREGVNHLPPTLAVRLERHQAVEAALRATTEAEALASIGLINERIRYVNSHATAGPPSTVMTVDPQEIIERWRAAHPSPEPIDAPAAATDDPPSCSEPRPRLRARMLRRRRS